MEYGQILSQLYNLPERPQPTAQPQRGMRGGMGEQPKFDYANFGLDKAPEGLQYTGDLAQKSQAIFGEWAQLRKYAKDMWVKHGVNILEPDPSNPDAVYAAQAFNQRLALLTAQIDEAKVGNKREELGIQAMLRGEAVAGPQYGQQFAGSTPFQQQFTTTQAGDATKEFISKQQGVLNITQQQANALNAKRDALIADYQDAKKNDPTNAGFYDAQIQTLLRQQATPAENTAPRDYGYGSGSAVFGIVNRVADTIAGIGFNDSGLVDTKSGKKVYYSSNNPIVQTSNERINGKPVVMVARVGEKLFLLNEDAVSSGTRTPTNSREFNPNTDAYLLIQQSAAGQGLGQELERLLPEFEKQGIIQRSGPWQFIMNAERALSGYGTTQLPATKKALSEDLSGSVAEVKQKISAELDDMAREDKWFQRGLRQLSTIATGAAPVLTPDLVKPLESKLFSSPNYPDTYLKVTVERSNGKPVYKYSLVDATGKVKKDKNGAMTYTSDNKQVVMDFIESKFNGLNDLVLERMASTSSEQYSDNQRKALEAFKKQFNREPSQDELAKILSKYK